ncbi:MAG: gliding motility protein GldL [Paludibacter sp.]|nr:gliding motility protein GldL [Paludibacter sp.]
MSSESKFDKAWANPKTQRIIGIFYSLGASVVIVGAMGKILHTDWGGAMLGAGMTIEAVLFALGALDKPHKETDWSKVIDFENGHKLNAGAAPTTAVSNASKPSLSYTESLNDDDVKKLSEGIKNLSTTANSLASLSTVAKSTENLSKNLDIASDATAKFIASQDVLNSATAKLDNAYKSISDGIQTVDKSTKVYAAKVDEINKSLSSINSIYEIQIKNVQAQSESLAKQADSVRTLDTNIVAVNAELSKMKSAAELAATQTNVFKANTEKLAKQVKDLNDVYGNMLNALN